jgi:hypothetical protein
MVSRQLNLLTVKKIFYSLMEQELENSQMEESENNSQMEHMRLLIDNDFKNKY